MEDNERFVVVYDLDANGQQGQAVIEDSYTGDVVEKCASVRFAHLEAERLNFEYGN